jgi:hypothetical protein
MTSARDGLRAADRRPPSLRPPIFAASVTTLMSHGGGKSRPLPPSPTALTRTVEPFRAGRPPRLCSYPHGVGFNLRGVVRTEIADSRWRRARDSLFSPEELFPPSRRVVRGGGPRRPLRPSHAAGGASLYQAAERLHELVGHLLAPLWVVAPRGLAVLDVAFGQAERDLVEGGLSAAISCRMSGHLRSSSTIAWSPRTHPSMRRRGFCSWSLVAEYPRVDAGAESMAQPLLHRTPRNYLRMALRRAERCRRLRFDDTPWVYVA